jgi:hypothetical protein
MLVVEGHKLAMLKPDRGAKDKIIDELIGQTLCQLSLLCCLWYSENINLVVPLFEVIILCAADSNITLAPKSVVLKCVHFRVCNGFANAVILEKSYRKSKSRRKYHLIVVLQEKRCLIK